MVRFDGFEVAAPLVGIGLSFSARPQSIGTHRARGDERLWWPAGRVVERSYLGECWDYRVTPEGGVSGLRVRSGPMEEFAVGASVWLSIGQAQAAPLPGQCAGPG